MLVHYGRYLFKYRSYHKRLQELADKDDTDIESDSKIRKTEPSWVFRPVDIYAEWANGIGKISQDVPINRFINFTFSYAMFVALIILTIADPSLQHFPDKEKPNMRWVATRALLLAYILSFFYLDVFIIVFFRKKVFARYWRIFDLTFHVLLGTSVVSNWFLYATEEETKCLATGNTTSPTSTSSFYHSPLLANEATVTTLCHSLVQLSNVTFALGNATFKLLRLTVFYLRPKNYLYAFI